MSSYRRSDDDLAYGELPPNNRWDRSRFERARYEERDRYGRAPRAAAPVLEEDRVRGRFEERRIYEDPAPRFASRVRREVFEDIPRETSHQALQPYRRKDDVDRDIIIDIERRREAPPARPGLLRRQSSLDTFDRPRASYGRELEPYVRRQSPPRRTFREEDFEVTRYRDAPPRGEVRDVEIIREREITKRGRAKSDVRSTRSDARSSVSKTSASSTSRASSSPSQSPARLPGKKGHTKLPKGQFKRFAVERFNVPFTEEGEFFRLQRALDKQAIDTILEWSREAREPRVKTYKFEDDQLVDGRDHYEAIRTEWINPPSVRAASPTRSHRSQRTVRAPSPPPPPPPAARHEDITIIREQQAPPPPPAVVIQPPAPPPVMQMAPQVQPMALAVTQRTDRTHAEIEAEIRQLTNERDQIYYERTGQFVQPVMAPYSGYQVVPYRPSREREREYVEYIERDSSPKREVIRVEKDRKEKKPNPKFVAAMMATLT